jgi:hypothetical protein
MPNTFELIASSTVGVLGATSIDFTSIPSTYTDLCIVSSLRLTVDGNLLMSFNGSSSNFTVRRLSGNGSSASSTSFSTGQAGTMTGSGQTSNTFSSSQIYIPNYASSTTNKSYSVESTQENNATASNFYVLAGLWSNTAAITSISLYPNDGPTYPFVQYSTAYLYGVKNA